MLIAQFMYTYEVDRQHVYVIPTTNVKMYVCTFVHLHLSVLYRELRGPTELHVERTSLQWSQAPSGFPPIANHRQIRFLNSVSSAFHEIYHRGAS